MLYEGVIRLLFINRFKKLSEKERLSYSVLRTKKVDDICIICVGRVIEREILRKSLFSYNRGWTRRIRFGGKWLTLYRCGVGSVDCNFNVKALHNAGARIIIRIDVCGGLKAHVGDIIIASIAVALNSFNTGRVGSNNLKADSSLLTILSEIVEKRLHNDRYLIGRVVTVDEFFEQNEDYLKRLSDFGLAVDMETSSLYYTANQSNIQAISIMCVSDALLLGEDITKSPETFPTMRYRKGIKNLIKILKELIKKL